MLKFLNALENLPEVVNKFMETIKVLFKKKIINKVIKETLKQIGQSFLSFSDQINQKEFKKLLKDMQSMNINQKIQYKKKETINVYDILGLLDHNIFYEDEYLCYFNALKTLHTPDSSFHIKITLEDIYEYLDTTIDWQKEMIQYLKNCSSDRKKEIEKYIMYLSIENCATFQLKIAPLKRDVIHHFTLNRHPLFY